MAGYFDSHAHYWDERFAAEWPGGAEALLPTLFAGEVTGIVNVGTSPETSRLAIAQAKQYPGMFAAAGIHPTDGEELPDTERAVREIDELFSHPENKLVALGEIGLDYHFPPFDRERQLALFHAQLDLARSLDVPVLVHDRDAHGDCVAAVQEHPGVRGVFHSFSGSAETAQELLRLGFYISFSGTVSFRNAPKVAGVARTVPRDRVLIETDCPYLAPHPHRGELNHSGLLPFTAAALAAFWEMDAEKVADITRQNAECFFRLPSGISPALAKEQ